MFNWLSTYLVGILSTLLLVTVVALAGLWVSNSRKQAEISKLNVELGVVAAMSQQQEVKIVESKQIEEKVKVITQDRIKIVKEYVYDTNKSDCDNAAVILSTNF